MGGWCLKENEHKTLQFTVFYAPKGSEMLVKHMFYCFILADFDKTCTDIKKTTFISSSRTHLSHTSIAVKSHDPFSYAFSKA